jgi:hypothetical protein
VNTQSRCVRLASLAIASFVLTATGFGGSQVDAAGRAPQGGDRAISVTPIPFAERNDVQNDVYNASGIVPLDDSRFLVCDNNTNHALLRLKVTPDGRQAGPLELIHLTGLAKDAVDDMEDLALVHEGGRWFIFATPSLSIKAANKKKGRAATVRPSGLVRITVAGDKKYSEEAMPGFRDWLLAHVPVLAAAAKIPPDEGGLNVEGVAWDAERRALLFGIRTPVADHKPIVVPVRIKDLGGKWDPSNLEALEPITLQVDTSVGDQGIRGMTPGPGGKGFLVTVANATSNDKAPCSVYAWDGNAGGVVRRLNVTFAAGMKAEGLTVGTVAGKPAVVFVDDGGGFKVVPFDEITGTAAPTP